MISGRICKWKESQSRKVLADLWIRNLSTPPRHAIPTLTFDTSGGLI